jgi:hypothetical protein
MAAHVFLKAFLINLSKRVESLANFETGVGAEDRLPREGLIKKDLRSVHIHG